MTHDWGDLESLLRLRCPCTIEQDAYATPVLEEFARAFTWQEGQCGVAFGIGRRILELEIFDHPEVMRRFFQKLVRSYALDALDAALATNGPASVEGVCALVSQISAAQSFMEETLGIGKDVRFNGQEICGAAVWARERYVRIYTFAKNGKNSSASKFLDAHNSSEPPPHVLSDAEDCEKDWRLTQRYAHLSISNLHEAVSRIATSTTVAPEQTAEPPKVAYVH